MFRVIPGYYNHAYLYSWSICTTVYVSVDFMKWFQVFVRGSHKTLLMGCSCLGGEISVTTGESQV